MQRCLERLRAGDATARGELLRHANEQLTRLARRLLRDSPHVRRWEETGDVLQNSSLRLLKALAEVTPRSLAEFFGLAALQVRRELIDLARKLYGPEGLGAHHASVRGDPDASGGQAPALDPGQSTCDPARLADWTEFHRLVDALPAEEREVFDLVYYQDLTQEEAAAVLGVTDRTVRKRWRAARLRVHDALGGHAPPW
jgi:RNA polymerase sigma-70 factor (ECF subfamily)